MSNTDLQRLTVDGVADKLTKYGMKCDVCGSTNWTIYLDGDGMTSLVSPLGIEETKKGFNLAYSGRIPCVAMRCRQCGQVKFFDATVLTSQEE